MNRNILISKTISKLAKNNFISEDGKEVLDLLQQALIAEFQQWDLYYAYKNRLKGLSRDPLMDHFRDHAQDEADHIDIIQRYIISMGATPTTDRKKIPQLNDESVEDIIQLQLKFEIEAVELYKNILSKIKEEQSPLRVEIENILAVEAEHMHDLQMLLRN